MRTELSVPAIKNLQPRAAAYEVADSKVVGLRIVVHPSGFLSWAVRYVSAGRNRKLTIGPFPRIGLKEARGLAAKALLAVAAGHDPAAEKAETRRKASASAADSVESIFKQYLARHLSKRRESHRKETERLWEKYILPKWRKKSIGEITRRDVIAIVDSVVDSGAPVTANSTLMAMSGFFNWALTRDLLPSSPCAGVKKPTKVKSRDRVLTDAELRWLWRACDEIGWPFGPANKLLILFGARRDEVREMAEKELRLADNLWILPGERAKNHREHEVHLTGLARSILESLPRVRNKAGFIFSTNGKTAPSGFSNSKDAIDRLMLQYAREEAKDPEKVAIPHWVLHDLRRTMASGMARLGIALPVIERCLNHVSGSFAGVVGIYQRHQFTEEKRAAFEKWSAHVEAIVTATPAKILPLKAVS